VEQADCEAMVTECVDSHLWVGRPVYCDKCGVDKGEERRLSNGINDDYCGLP